MSQSTTRLGQRGRGFRRAMSWISPPWRIEARRVRRQSMRAPCGLGWPRRDGIGFTGSDRRASIRFAWAISAVLICSKSRLRRRSSAGHGQRRRRPRSASPPRRLRVSGRSRSTPSSSASAARFSAGLGRALLLHAAHRRQQHRHHVLEIARIAPVEAEDLREDRAVFRARDEAGVQRPVEVDRFAVNPAASTARIASITRPGPIGSPALRRARAKWVMFCASFGSSGRVSGAYSAIQTARGRCPRTPGVLAARGSIMPARAPRGPGRGCVSPRSPAASGCRPGISESRPTCRRSPRG